MSPVQSIVLIAAMLSLTLLGSTYSPLVVRLRDISILAFVMHAVIAITVSGDRFYPTDIGWMGFTIAVTSVINLCVMLALIEKVSWRKKLQARRIARA